MLSNQQTNKQVHNEEEWRRRQNSKTLFSHFAFFYLEVFFYTRLRKWWAIILFSHFCCFLQTDELCVFVGCLTSQQHASVSQGWICSDNFMCCHTEIEIADPTFQLTQSQHIDTGPTSPSTDPILPGAWQGIYWSGNFWVTGMTQPWKNPGASGIRIWALPLSGQTP